MAWTDYAINLIIAIVLIVGGYQFYFFPQRYALGRIRSFGTKLDEIIPLKPGWIWVYSGLYYPIIVLTVLTFPSFQTFNYAVFNYLELLAAQLVFFIFLPVESPETWRNSKTAENMSMKVLRFVWRFDQRTNCFPSMHVSVATLTAFYLFDNTYAYAGSVSAVAFLFPLLIAISTLLTKQHFIVDLPAGAALGWAIYTLGHIPQ